MKRQLLLGGGSSRKKLFNAHEPWEDLVTLDMEPSHKPDVLWDLCRPIDIRLEHNSFDEIHAYDVLEHIGHQGNYEAFFREFKGYWNILKPGGFLFGIVPAWNSTWAWADPGHTRVITEGTLAFLSKEFYNQIGSTPATDYRGIYSGDLRLVQWEYRGRSDHPEERVLYFALQAVKD
jgi:hypothetical protein